MAVHEPVQLGSLLKRHRLAAGLTQEELAERAGVSTRSVSDLERGLSRTSHPNTVRRLADALELVPAERASFLEVATQGRGGQPAPIRSEPRQAPWGVPSAAWARIGVLGAACVLAIAVAGVSVALLDRGTKGSAAPVRSTAEVPAVVSTWGSASGQAVPFARPFWVIPAPGGTAYVLDDSLTSPAVVRISPSGQQLGAWRLTGLDNHLHWLSNSQVTDVKADAHGDLWMTVVLSAPVEGPGYGGTLPLSVDEFSPDGRLLTRWGSDGVNPGEFSLPQGLGITSRGDVVVSDSGNHRMQVLTPSGKALAVWSGPGSDPLKFWADHVAVDAHDNVYTLDFGNRQIEKYSLSGKLLAIWHPAGLLNGVPLTCCDDLTLDPQGNIYVLWSGPDFFEIYKLSPSGRLLAMWNHFGRHPAVTSDVTSMRFDGQGFAWVAARGARRVLKVDESGHVVASWTARQLARPVLQSPSSIAADKAGNVYVSDTGRVVRIPTNGTSIRSWSTGGAELSSPGSPELIAIDPHGNPVVLDSNGDGVSTYSPLGKSIGAWGKRGNVLGDLGQPLAVGVDGRGNLVVDDTAYDAIEVFSAAGKLLRYWDTSSFSPPVAGVPDPMAVDRAGNVYLSVVDKVIKFSPAGVPLRSWGRTGLGPGRFAFAGAVAVDSRGDVYATDMRQNRLQIFSPTGRLLASWTGLSVRGSHFVALGGLTVDPKGNIYVIDGAQLLELAPLAT